MKRHLCKCFQLPGHIGFLQDTFLFSLIRPILRHHLSVKITGYLTRKASLDLSLKVATELSISFPGFGWPTLGVLLEYLDYCYIYFI